MYSMWKGIQYIHSWIHLHRIIHKIKKKQFKKARHFPKELEDWPQIKPLPDTEYIKFLVMYICLSDGFLSIRHESIK